MAGVLDARGSRIQVEDYRHPPHDFIYTNLVVSSNNLALLTALHQEYYGSQPVRNGNRPSSYIWHVGQGDYESLMTLIHPYLQLKRDLFDPSGI
jgi:hypothetical protein